MKDEIEMEAEIRAINTTICDYSCYKYGELRTFNIFMPKDVLNVCNYIIK